MELDKKKMKKIMMLIVFAAFVFICFYRINDVRDGLFSLLSILTPFLLGIGIAVFLNVFIRPLEDLINHKKKYRHSRLIAFLLTVILLAGLIVVFLLLIIPQVANTISQLIKAIPPALDKLQHWFNGLVDEYPVYAGWLEGLNINLVDIFNKVGELVQRSLMSLLGTTLSAVSKFVVTLINLFIGIVFAVYLLMQKENLGRQLSKLVRAFFSEKRSDSLLYIFKLAGRTFSSFVAGQCLEAVILGVLCYLGMTILRFPYALMISVLTMFCALIPVFGAWFSAFFGALLILIISPAKALLFLVFMLVLQQVEGNVIYPRTMSKNIQLPAIWILFAVTLGGKLFGVIGMVVFIPICSVIYTVLREVVNNRLDRKKKNGLQSAEENNEIQ
jgi:predicted PurR-regulated permease PerM